MTKTKLNFMKKFRPQFKLYAVSLVSPTLLRVTWKVQFLPLYFTSLHVESLVSPTLLRFTWKVQFLPLYFASRGKFSFSHFTSLRRESLVSPTSLRFAGKWSTELKNNPTDVIEAKAGGYFEPNSKNLLSISFQILFIYIY